MKVQFRTHENGGVCCSSTNEAGERIAPKHPCGKCAVHFASTIQEDSMRNDYAAPDPYQLGLRAAEATSPSFEDGWKRSRLEALDAERSRHDAGNAAIPRFPRLTAAQLAEYAAPDGYRIALDKMKVEAR